MLRKRLMVVIIAVLLCIHSIRVYAGYVWIGWDDNNRENAWNVFDITNWNKFSELGIVPCSFVENTAKASVSFMVRSYEAELKEQLMSYSLDYSSYTELMLVILAQRNGAFLSSVLNPDIYLMSLLMGNQGMEYSKTDSIKSACDLLVNCVLKINDVSPYKLDGKLQAVVAAWYVNDPNLISYFSGQKYEKNEMMVYLNETYSGTEEDKNRITMEEISDVMDFLTAHYSCTQITKSGTAYASGEVAAASAGTINPDTRMEWLFPNGIPNSTSTMQEYLVWIKVPCKTPKGIEYKLMNVHKALADDIKAVFEELLDVEDYYIIPDELYCFSWRMMASGTGSRSMHSYGIAIDVNPSANPATYSSSNPPDISSCYFNNKKVVDIWKSHGFYWGGDWSGYYYDPMHFTYTNR